MHRIEQNRMVIFYFLCQCLMHTLWKGVFSISVKGHQFKITLILKIIICPLTERNFGKYP